MYRLIKSCFLLVLLMLTWAISGCQASYSPEEPKAANGILDLTGWDFAHNGPVELNGDWEFYWEQLLTPEDFRGEGSNLNKHLISIPRSWNSYEIDAQPIAGEGYATFRLKVLLPPDNQITSD